MQCIITYPIGMQALLSKASSEIQIFNLGYLLTKHSIYT